MADCFWTDPIVNGDPSVPTTFNNKQVIVTTPALTSFAFFMKTQTSFSYDYAIGLFDKYLFTPSQQIVQGYSSDSGSICATANPNRFGLVVDFGGFSNIIVNKN